MFRLAGDGIPQHESCVKLLAKMKRKSSNPPPISLREKQSIAKRNQILDAAERLIRDAGNTDFSMRSLASIAEVAPATPYNLFGSKEGLLFELLARSLTTFLEDALVSKSDDPLQQALDAADNAVKILTDDPVFLRPLYQVMLGLTDPTHHPAFIKDAFVFYRRALDGMMLKELLIDEHERETLACSLMAYFMGVLDLWVQKDIEHERFRAQIAYGFIHMLWPYAQGHSLKLLKARHAKVMAILANKRTQPEYLKSSTNLGVSFWTLPDR